MTWKEAISIIINTIIGFIGGIVLCRYKYSN